MERTLLFVKPDGVARGLIGEIIKRFEQKGFSILALKKFKFTEDLARKHYAEHVDKPFFPGLLKYILDGACVAMVIEGNNCVEICRKMMGATSPADALPGTIRGDFANNVTYNIIHGSDSVERAKVEIGFFFNEEELIS